MSRTQSVNFKKLVEKYFASLFRFAHCLTGDEPAACDLTQQTFFIYANHGSALGDAQKVKIWLFATLHNEFLRHRAAPHIEPRPAAPKAAAGMALAAPENVAALDGPSAAALLAELDETARAPLALFYLHELTYPEIAEALARPLPNVLAQVADGKTQLKKILADRARQP